ncbi:MAG: CAP domain-containing protein [Oscillospiraceae bacterium]|nr:CAP domain-containing protein [Oscillospiraceae bacterium]
MKKTYRFSLIFLLIFTFLLGVTACGSKTLTDLETSSEITSTEETTSTESEETSDITEGSTPESSEESTSNSSATSSDTPSRATNNTTSSSQNTSPSPNPNNPANVSVILSLNRRCVYTGKGVYKVGETDFFKIEIHPQNATINYEIISSNPNVLSINQDGSFSCKASGEVDISVKTPNGTHKSSVIRVINVNEFAAEVVRLTNIERVKFSLPPLSGSDSKLNTAAMVRATETTILYSHTRPDGRRPGTAYQDLGGERDCGENIAQGQLTPESVVDTWMRSEGHKQNILTPGDTHIGVGVDFSVERSDFGDYYNVEFYWVQLFITLD